MHLSDHNDMNMSVRIKGKRLQASQYKRYCRTKARQLDDVSNTK